MVGVFLSPWLFVSRERHRDGVCREKEDAGNMRCRGGERGLMVLGAGGGGFNCKGIHGSV